MPCKVALCDLGGFSLTDSSFYLPPQTRLDLVLDQSCVAQFSPSFEPSVSAPYNKLPKFHFLDFIPL